MRRLPSALFTAAAVLLAGLATPGQAARPDQVGTAAGWLRTGHLGRIDGSVGELVARLVPGTRIDRAPRQTLIGTSYRGRAYRDGLPVAGTDVVAIVRDGELVALGGGGLDLPKAGRRAPHVISTAHAVTAAVTALGTTALLAPAHIEHLLTRRGDALVDSYVVDVAGVRPARFAQVTVDAASGAVLAVRDNGEHVDGTALVFDPNPVVSSRRPLTPAQYTSGLDVDSDTSELTAARRAVPVKELNTSGLLYGRLSGPWASVQGAGTLSMSGNTIDVKRAAPAFEAVMAYVHIDRVQRDLQRLGIHANDNAQSVYALPIAGFDNSLYQPGVDLLVFGAGGVDDAEDAEIVVHEYAHAVQDAQTPGVGGGDLATIKEGYADFVAAAEGARLSRGFGDTCFGEWDTQGEGPELQCLRRLDSPKRFPAAVVEEEHLDGEMWASMLWRIRQRIGTTVNTRSDNGLALVVTANELIVRNATYALNIKALRTAADALKHPEWSRIIDEEATRTGYKLT